MKRLHFHLRVDDLARSIEFYTALFGSAPSLVKHDYAKWQVDEPRVNFAVSKRGGAAGLDHLGLPVDAGAELTEVARTQPRRVGTKGAGQWRSRWSPVH